MSFADEYLTEEDYEIANKNGISRKLAYDRVYEYDWSVERAITEPVNLKNIPTGLWEKWKGICESNGVSHQLFRTRISRARKKGMTMQQAIEYAAFEPVKQPRGYAANKKSIDIHLAAYSYSEVERIYA